MGRCFLFWNLNIMDFKNQLANLTHPAQSNVVWLPKLCSKIGVITVLPVRHVYCFFPPAFFFIKKLRFYGNLSTPSSVFSTSFRPSTVVKVEGKKREISSIHIFQMSPCRSTMLNQSTFPPAVGQWILRLNYHCWTCHSVLPSTNHTGHLIHHHHYLHSVLRE